MSHPQQELLDQFSASIERLVPLTPPEIIDEARQLVDELGKSEATSAEQIRQAFVLFGRKEFPYRKAYEALCAGDEEQRLQEIVLAKLDDVTKASMDAVTKYGVHVVDFVKSSQFEQLLPDQQTAIDNAIREAHDVLNKQCDDRAMQRQQDFESLVKSWREKGERIQSMIEALRTLAERSETHAADILAKAREFEDGWSMLEPDPTEEDVQREFDSWVQVLDDSEDEEALED
jgi:hypothetical protein